MIRTLSFITVLIAAGMLVPRAAPAQDLSSVIEQVIRPAPQAGGQHGAEGTAEAAEEDEPATIAMPVVKLRSLDKVTARTGTFEAAVGRTVKFGSLYIKARTCQKASPLEKPESAAFLQVWEIDKSEDGRGDEDAEWVFSGWMFASSPGRSSMDHPVYDVWVLDCLDQKTETPDADERGEGEIQEDQIPVKPEGLDSAPE